MIEDTRFSRSVARWGTVRYRQMLRAVAAAASGDANPAAEAATVTRLVRPVAWDRRGTHMSMLSTPFVTLATRTARQLSPGASGITVLRQPARRQRTDNPRFEVLVPVSMMDTVAAALATHWQETVDRLSRPSPHTASIARTVWRAALLVSSSDRRRSQLRVSVPCASTAAVLSAAGSALAVAVATHRRRGGSHFVTVDDPADAVRLLRAVGAGPAAEAWVKVPVRAGGQGVIALQPEGRRRPRVPGSEASSWSRSHE
jgi:hypothetical protein